MRNGIHASEFFPRRNFISVKLMEITALVDTPIATRDMSNQLLEKDILSKKGIVTHTERVLRFLFRKEK